MAATADYLNKLIMQKNTLADNLIIKGVTANHDETLETLIPKVLDISEGTNEQFGVYPIGEDGLPTGNVTVPNNVLTLSGILFKGNNNIISVIFGKDLSEISTYSFQNCTSLQEINIPDKVSVIPRNCFDGCSLLNNITLPNSIRSIDAYSFQNCTSLQEINIPDNVTSIGVSAFNKCINLTSVVISENANYSLGQNAFYASGVTDTCVTDILLHASSVSSNIFTSCNSLENIEVPLITQSMFSECVNLKTVTLTSYNNSTIGTSAFYKDTALEKVILCEGITTIGNSVFRDCTALKTVYLPSSITTANSNSLTVTSASHIFYNCTALEDVQLGQDWNMSLRLDVSNNITVESMVAMFNSLKDLTGDTAKTLTLGSTNLAKLTDEQKAIAINKNWTLA